MYIIHFTLHGNCDGVQHWVREERRENVHACSADYRLLLVFQWMYMHAHVRTYVYVQLSAD